MGSRIRPSEFDFWLFSLNCCVVLNYLSLSFLISRMGLLIVKSASQSGIVRLNEITHVKYFTQCLADVKISINDSCFYLRLFSFG